MACNCAANDQLEKLYKEFGQKRDLAKGEGFLFRIKRQNVLREYRVIQKDISNFSHFYY